MLAGNVMARAHGMRPYYPNGCATANKGALLYRCSAAGFVPWAFAPWLV